MRRQEQSSSPHLRRRVLGFMILCLFCSFLAPAQQPRKVTLFESARLVMGDGGAAIESAAFIVENDRFTSVGRKGEIQLPAGAARVDLAGKTVIPALIDVHSH